VEYAFGTHAGLVRVWAVAHLDASLRPIKLDVEDIERMQGDLFPVDDEGDEG
jgi:hypothetical protein